MYITSSIDKLIFYLITVLCQTISGDTITEIGDEEEVHNGNDTIYLITFNNLCY